MSELVVVCVLVIVAMFICTAIICTGLNRAGTAIEEATYWDKYKYGQEEDRRIRAMKTMGSNE